MRHANHNIESESPGGDSFLDIVANIVGILVLLVVVVGVRAAREVFVPDNTSAEASQKRLAELKEETESLLRQATTDRREALELREKVLTSHLEAERREQERAEATLYVTEMRAKLDEARATFDPEQQREIETQNALAQAQLKLDKLAAQQIALSATEPEQETVTITPTPIVDGRADKLISFRLLEDRLVYVPVTELELELAKNITIPTVRDPSRAIVTNERVGPIEGFEADAEIIWAIRFAGGRMGLMPKVGRMIVRESTELRGEQASNAFSPGGYVASRIDLLDPDEFAIRLIVYEDSFDSAPEVAQQFRERGFRVAQSLKSEGSQIGFSSDGYKAVTQ